MSAWKKSAAALAVAAAGVVGTGYAVVSGGGEQAAAPPTAAAPHPPEPAPAHRLRTPDAIKQYLRAVADEIKELELGAAELQIAEAERINAVVIRAALERLDARLLTAEDEVPVAAANADGLRKRLRAFVAKPAEPVNDPLSPQAVQGGTPYQATLKLLQSRRAEYEDAVKKSDAPDAPIVLRAQAALKHAEAEVATARKAYVTSELESGVKSAEDRHVAAKENVDHMRRKRRELVGRLTEGTLAAGRAASLDDRLAVLRDVRRQLFREQLAAELGLPAGPAAAVDDGVAARLDRLARRIDELQAKIDELASKPAAAAPRRGDR